MSQTKKTWNVFLDSTQRPQEMGARTGIVGWTPTTDDSDRQMLSFDIYLKGNVPRAVLVFQKCGEGKPKIPDVSRMWRRSGE